MSEFEKQPLATESEEHSESSSTVAASVKQDKKTARKLVEEEKRAVGRISSDIWKSYVLACGHVWYWVIFMVVLLLASLSPVLENGWLRYLSFFLRPLHLSSLSVQVLVEF
jgi:hypothetical protein